MHLVSMCARRYYLPKISLVTTVYFFMVSNKFPPTEVLPETISDAPAKIRKRSNESRNFAEFPLGNRDGWYCKTFTTRIMMRSEVGRVCGKCKKKERRRALCIQPRDSYNLRSHRA